MKLRTIVCAVLCLCVCSVAHARGRRGYSNSTGSTAASQNAVVDKAPVYTTETQLLNQVNAERQRYGLAALILDPIVHMRARRHCGWMANNRQMVHSVDGAENIAMGSSTVDGVMVQWMNSSGHRANILNPGYRKIGIAGYVSPEGTPYWCQQFE